MLYESIYRALSILLVVQDIFHPLLAYRFQMVSDLAKNAAKFCSEHLGAISPPHGEPMILGKPQRPCHADGLGFNQF